MHLNPFIALVGLSGGELILILFALIVMFALPIAAIVVVAIFWKRRKSSSSSAPPFVTPNTRRFCPQCHTELAPDAPQGLCPQCLARAAFETQAGGAQQRSTSAMPIEQIAKFFPQLEIVELLGHGGMGVVYKARQPHLDRFVALKILSPELSRDPAFAERFNREARALARLNHPNIVAVYESGKAGDFYYLVMEYVDGLNLAQMQAAKKRIAPEEAFAIVPKICDALQYAHDEGVVHRDIKPANILMDKRGRVKIADFGLAKMLGHEVTGLGLTQTRGMMGTPQYMAPEQLEKPLQVDHRADIYSLGVVFYEMLTGELPLGRFPEPSKKVQIDVRLDEIVLRTLEKEPELRYQQATEVKTALENVASSRTDKTSKGTPDETLQWQRESPLQIVREWEHWTNFMKRLPTPHFSLVAIIGAMFAVLSVAAIALQLTGSHPDILWCSPVVTTVLGWIAIAQIRHSSGKLYGLGLAAFDALAFPIVALDAAISLIPLKLINDVNSGEYPSMNPWGVICVSVFCLIVIITLDCVIAIVAWRAIKRHATSPIEPAPHRPMPGPTA